MISIVETRSPAAVKRKIELYRTAAASSVFWTCPSDLLILVPRTLSVIVPVLHLAYSRTQHEESHWSFGELCKKSL